MAADRTVKILGSGIFVSIDSDLFWARLTFFFFCRLQFVPLALRGPLENWLFFGAWIERWECLLAFTVYTKAWPTSVTQTLDASIATFLCLIER